MTADAFLQCDGCGARHAESANIAECPACGGLLSLELASIAGPGDLRAAFDRRAASAGSPAASGVWRYRELVHSGVRLTELVSLREGQTPLYDGPGVTALCGARLSLKHEGMNPTGSFKDRGMTVAVTQAKRLGARAIACASTGNTSASAAAYAAAAGLPCHVFIPAGAVALGKLAQTRGYGARIFSVRGDFDVALRLVREATARHGLYLVNSINPFRIAGQQSIVFELLHQMDWSVPDYIALPAGNLGNVSAFGMAIRRMLEAGLIDRAPRLIAVQAAGAAPFARGFDEGFVAKHSVKAETVATAIRIGAPASWDRAVRAIRETNGLVVSVPDHDILAAKHDIDRLGIGCEPASAASVAGIRALIARGQLSRDDVGVAILTGNMLKDPDATDRGASPVVDVEPTLDAISTLLQ